MNQFDFAKVSVKVDDCFIDQVNTLPNIQVLTHEVTFTQIQKLGGSGISTQTAESFLRALIAKEEDALQAAREHDRDEKIKKLQRSIARTELLITEAEGTGRCPICWEQVAINDPVSTTCCQNTFCRICIIRCSKQCPMCRVNMIVC
ncbi:MAG: RING-H2 finger protein [Sphingobacteriaceae bacterium]|nr:MAG: RING-H2 finger protein [Sphingobacteriaceae bacterium]